VSRSRTIKVELLREGPPHNQLLSPLTRYLAACQNRPPESIRIEIEHRDFLRWQAGLTYAAGRVASPRDQKTRREAKAAFEVDRRNAIEDASKAVTTLLGSIRALIAELSSDPCEWRHIHLVVDASELGSLPFELARAAPGLMVEGERLFVQQNARVTLSRQTRRVATSVVSWPNRPRILCIIAEGNLPTDAHVLALRKSIDHWIGWNDRDDSLTGNTDPDEGTDEQLLKNRKLEAGRMLTVLENPTLDKVSETAGSGRFTHVHILAHGAPLAEAGAGQSLYGLCFRGANGLDVIDGDRLEAALRHKQDCSQPTVVTLATCEGANVSGAILGPGGSAAHAIHSKGVPLVIASQFPLSKGASVIATEMLYWDLLRGEDPRETVHAIRRELLVAYPDTHDWASLVVYASLPNDVDDQLRAVKRGSDRLAAETAIERFRATLRGKTESAIRGNNIEEAERERLVDDVDRLDKAVAVIRASIDCADSNQARTDGNRFLGRLAMRLYDAYTHRTSPFEAAISTTLQRFKKHDFTTGRRPISTLAPKELLRLAKDSYEIAHRLDGSQWELWVQVVALCWALEPNAADDEQFKSDLNATRYMAQLLVDRAANATTDAAEQRALAAAIAFEVELLAYFTGKEQNDPSSQTFIEKLDKKFELFLRAASPVPESYRAHAAWRQLRRYLVWTTGRPSVPGQPLRPDGVKMGELITKYIDRLKKLGVRRYWGPRTVK